MVLIRAARKSDQYKEADKLLGEIKKKEKREKRRNR